MRQNRAALAALILALLLPLTGCQGRYGSHLLFLIAEREEGFYWENLVQGASLAAKDSGWTMEKAYLTDGEDVEALLSLAGDRGADLIALALAPGRLPEGYDGQAPLLVLGADAERLPAAVRISNEEATIGKREGQLLGKRIGLQKKLMLVVADEALGGEWETALRGELGLQGSQVAARIACGDDANLAYARCRRALEAHPEIEGIVCDSESATNGALRAVRALGAQTPIVGADFNPSIALGLRDGLVCLTVVRNAYATGYMGVENGIRIAGGKPAAAKKQLDAVYVDADNMFGEEMSVFLFEVD